MISNADDARYLAGLLPESAHHLIPAIVDHFTPEWAPKTVHVRDTGVPVMTVQTYGLTLHADADGIAATLYSSRGFIIGR